MTDPLVYYIQKLLEPHLKRGTDPWGLAWEIARAARNNALDELLGTLRQVVEERRAEEGRPHDDD